jgi:hypothetical protein
VEVASVLVQRERLEVSVHGEHLLVQSRLLLGRELMGMEIDSDAIGHALGEGIAALYGVPLSDQDKIDFESRFYGGVDLHGYVTGIVEWSANT